MMMDGIHWRLVSTLPEDEFWYDDIHAELENHYKDRIIQMYNERKGINESVLREENFIPLESLNIVIKDYQDGFNVHIMNGDKKIGEISFAKENLPNMYTIVDATIDDEYKGNRIYPKTIINLFKERPNIIINSLFRSPEAQKAWIYLLSNLPSNIAKSVKHYKDEGTTLFQLKSRNLQESIRKVLREETSDQESVKDLVSDMGLYQTAKMFGGVENLYKVLGFTGTQEEMIFIVDTIMRHDVPVVENICDFKIKPTKNSLIVYIEIPKYYSNLSKDSFANREKKATAYFNTLELIYKLGNGLVRGHTIQVSIGDC